MRVAALYDIHGNLPALDAVLSEVGDVDAIVIGGDIAEGPFPRETLERVLALERTHLIRGNWERADCGLDGAAASFLAGLPLTVTLDVDGLGPTCFCHATPRADDELFTERTPSERVAEMVAAVSEAVIVCGHTHLQIDHRVGAKRIVNAGSVGFPWDAVGAEWALLGPDVELRRTQYDRDAAYEQFVCTAWHRPGRPQLLVELMLVPRPRAEALDFLEGLAAPQRGA